MKVKVDRFLCRHARTEHRLKLNPHHVILDRDEWVEVRIFLRRYEQEFVEHMKGVTIEHHPTGVIPC